MIVGQTVVDTAREWLGTPYQHQARTKHIGADCIGLIIGVLVEIDALPEEIDPGGYPALSDGQELEKRLRQWCLPIETIDACEGDIIVFEVIGTPQHVGFASRTSYGEPGLIHSYSPLGKVVEHRLDANWQSRIRFAWRRKVILPGEKWLN